MNLLKSTQKYIRVLMIIGVFLLLNAVMGETAVVTHALEDTKSIDLEEIAAEEIVTGNCRYGVYATSFPGVPWLSTLGAGWYVSYNPTPPSQNPGNGAEFVYTLRMKFGVFDPPLSAIDDDLVNNPGALYLVGNEMEVNYPTSGDKTTPWDYAVAYKQAYDHIKQADPTARVAVGAMSMATPLRLDYMSEVWDAYNDLYGVDMPVDVWNVHIYILSERYRNSVAEHWAHYPMGHDQYYSNYAATLSQYLLRGKEFSRDVTETYVGPCGDPNDNIYCVAEHDSPEIIKDQIVAFRQWMKDHGQQNKPLILSEIALLHGAGTQDELGNQFYEPRVSNFLDNVYGYLESEAAKDASLGYPADENRLVQQWSWFSLKVDPGWQGRLANLLVDDHTSYPDGDVNALTSVGVTHRNWMLNNAAAASFDLQAGTATDVTTEAGGGGFGSATIEVSFRNNGTKTTNQSYDVTFYKDAALTQPIGTQTFADGLSGCAWGYDTHKATAVWENIPPGTHTYWAKIDSGDVLSEVNTANNVTTGTVTVNANLVPFLEIDAQGVNAWLHWADIPVATKYNLFRHATNPYFTPGTAYQNPVPPEYTDANVLANPGTYYYAVRVDDNGLATYPISNRVGAFTFEIVGGTVVLQVPQLAVQINGGHVVLDWADDSGATSFRVYRENQPYQPVGEAYVTVVNSTFSDRNEAQTLQSRFYWVTASDGSQETPLSNQVGKFSFQIVAGS